MKNFREPVRNSLRVYVNKLIVTILVFAVLRLWFLLPCIFSYFLLQWQIKVDNQPPQINGCPRNIEETTELGTSTKIVTWTEPTATDNSGTPSRTRSHQPGAAYTLGVTNVRYTFTDTFNNVATCTFTVTLTSGWFNLFENCMWSFCDVIYSNNKRLLNSLLYLLLYFLVPETVLDL